MYLDLDSKNLVDSALAAHSQMTLDVGEAMSSAILCRRQIWLTQTSLPEAIRSELMNLPVMPGHVFKSDSQEVLDRAEHSKYKKLSSRLVTNQLHCSD